MKTPRVTLCAAALLCSAGLVTRPALAGDASAVWSDLWRTPNQQGQALLDAGKPAAAAARFQDPRRRAYADIEAGAYPQAAKLLAPFTDPESEYNRGNALAESGQLLAALSSYEAALKQAPGDKDIRHNRDVVERQLRQQRQSGQSSSGSGRQGSSGQRQSRGGHGKGGGSRHSGAGGAQSGAGQSASNGSSGSQAGAGQSGRSGQQAASPQASDAQGRSAKDSRAQARRDAAFAAGLQRGQQQQGKAGETGRQQGSQQNGTSNAGRKSAGQPPETGRRLAGGSANPKQKPETEQQLALDQWLRQIPDSPAGLLRRKFLIQHMIKDQGGAAPVESPP
jgi:Ca-activated chloride channel family protein